MAAEIKLSFCIQSVLLESESHNNKYSTGNPPCFNEVVLEEGRSIRDWENTPKGVSETYMRIAVAINIFYLFFGELEIHL